MGPASLGDAVLKEDNVELKTIEEILDYAISNEEKAAELYYDLADKVERPGMKEAFLHFAKEEEGHKARLLQIKEREMPQYRRQAEIRQPGGNQVQAWRGRCIHHCRQRGCLQL